MVKIQKLPSGQLVITIPKLLAEYEGLKKGVELEFKKHKDGFLLEIKKKGVKTEDR
ncbi:hypothetical protein HYX02_05460 [Candidatus Woesearchaeota archaeon]|nr:hypothetical protein [Candidatus Woesearchaeota archaeon]